MAKIEAEEPSRPLRILKNFINMMPKHRLRCFGIAMLLESFEVKTAEKISKKMCTF